MARKGGKRGKTSKQVKVRKNVKNKKSNSQSKPLPFKHTHVGIKLVIVYTFLIAAAYLGYFIAKLMHPSLAFLEQSTILLVDLFLLISILTILYGFIERKPWAWKFSITWYGLTILYSFFHVTQVQHLALQQVLFTLAVIVGLVQLFMIWYVKKSKAYFFYGRQTYFDKHDKLFVHAFLCFWILAALIGFTIVHSYYQNLTFEAKAIIERTNTLNEQAFQDVCKAKQGEHKDLCFVIMAVKYHMGYCNQVESAMYQLVCSQV
jgi:hypothetical protein